MITSPRQGLKKTETRAESPKNCSCSGGKRKPPWKSQEKWKYISVRVTTYNICDLRVAILENSNLPLVATILEKCSRSKERFPFTSSISALFGTWEHTNLLIYFFFVEYGSEVFEWLVIWECCLSHFDGTIPRSVILLFMCIFWRILFTNSDDWLEQLLMWFLRLSHMWWIHFFN